jgi:hypothetical protein
MTTPDTLKSVLLYLDKIGGITIRDTLTDEMLKKVINGEEMPIKTPVDEDFDAMFEDVFGYVANDVESIVKPLDTINLNAIWPSGLEARKNYIRGQWNELSKKYGLNDWTFVFDSAKSRNGITRYDKKQISISYHILNSDNSPKEWAMNTLLHEIAHALTPGTGHNQIWRQKAIEIGSDGLQYAKEPAGKFTWFLYCPRKCIEIGRFRKPNHNKYSQSICSTCTGPILIRQATETTQMTQMTQMNPKRRKTKRINTSQI